MARVSSNPKIESLRGEEGNFECNVQIDPAYVVCRSTKNLTPAQRAHRKRFTGCSVWVNRVMSNPEERAVYEEAARKRRCPVGNLIRKDYMSPPVIHDVNLDGYNGQPGDVILIRATEAFEVAFVLVGVFSPEGEILEEGSAEKSGIDPDLWAYAATTAVPDPHMVAMNVLAVDRPGNCAQQIAFKE